MLTSCKASSAPDSFFLDPESYRIPSKTLRAVKEWLSTCDASHSECKRQSQNIFVPKRLVQLTRCGNDWQLRLRYCSERTHYTALSYCWGGEQEISLTSANERLWERSQLDWQSLPLTIQDAVLVTFVLGYQFIWIDSLCILQDDEADKAIQIAQMPRIYDNATLTLSAVGANSVHDGLFTPMRRPLLHAENIFKLPARRGPQDSVDAVMLVPSEEVAMSCLEDGMGTAPLDARAWTFQETLLSRRLLKFTRNEMRWECQKLPEGPFGKDMENGLHDQVPLHPALSRIRHRANFNYINEAGRLFCSDGRKSAWPDSKLEQPDMYPWHALVQEYTTRCLSFTRDRAVAISGIAERVGIATGDVYCAGLWKSCLVNQLGWYNALSTTSSDPGPATGIKLLFMSQMTGPTGFVCYQSGGSCSLPTLKDLDHRQVETSTKNRPWRESTGLKTPSWSWLSSCDPVLFHVSGVLFTIEVVDVMTQPFIAAAPYGDVDVWELVVRGLVGPVDKSRKDNSVSPGMEPDSASTGSFLLLKLGEYQPSAVAKEERVICLELERTSERHWARSKLVMSSDEGWIGTRTLKLI